MSTSGTDFQFAAGQRGAPNADVLIVPVPFKPQPPMELVARVDRHCHDAVAALLAVGALREDVGSLAHTTARGGCPRVLLVSLGDFAKLNTHLVHLAGASTARWLVQARVKKAAVWIDGLTACPVERATAAFALGMALAGYRFEVFKKAEKPAPAKVSVALHAGDAGHVARVLPTVKEALTLAEAMNYTRSLGHLPANVINPATLAAEAKKLARTLKLKCTVHEKAALTRFGMNGLLGVGGGALHPPALIQLEYRGAPRARTHTVLVGKSITFDTGGYSIKPAAGMEWMKFDKCGGTTVLGVLHAAAKLKLKCNITGLLAAAENAVSEKAYRPGDILRLASGKTVEINNTDAEGRLVLADALWYAQEKLKATEVIDLATLTGGVGVALGRAAAGLMSTHDQLAADLGEAGRRTHERLWRLPLWDDYRELIKSSEADIKNSAGKRDAHAIVGGMFLKEFVKDATPWAHLDIASVAYAEENHSLTGKGATGFGVRLLVEYLRMRGA